MEKIISQWLERHMVPIFLERGLPVDMDTSFDALGLDSLARVELITALENQFNVNLDPVLGFEYPTIRSLSEHIAHMEQSDGQGE
jgi:acyl carrier protein